MSANPYIIANRIIVWKYVPVFPKIILAINDTIRVTKSDRHIIVPYAAPNSLENRSIIIGLRLAHRKAMAIPNKGIE